MNIGILFGGNSLEHEISIVTAFQLKRRLEKDYNVNMIYIDYDNSLYIANKVRLNDFKNNNLKGLKKTSFKDKGVKGIDLDCIILSVHGENAEDGVAAALCRFYHIPYVGSNILASSIALDKYRCYKYLSNNGIKMIDSILYTYEDYLSGKEIGIYPCIIKPLYGGSSIGITVCKSKIELDNKLIEAFKISNRLIVQRYYENIEEYNLALYENGVSRLEKIDIKNDFFTFEDKYASEFKLMHKAMSDDSLYSKFKDIGRSVYNLLEASGIIRIDFFMIENEIYVNEVNIIPGALSMYLFDNFDRVIRECINSSILKKYNIYSKGNFLAKSDINK